MKVWRNPSRSNYNLVSVFDSYWGEWQSEWNNEPDARLCPNIPMTARKTLLAEMLKKGKHLFSSPEKYQPTKPVNLQQRLGNSWSEIFKIEKLVGKLIGVEIEYYPEDTPKRTIMTRVGSDGSLAADGVELRKLTWVGQSGRLYGVLRLNLTGRVTSRCGLHIHIDARHLGQNGLLNTVETYDKLVKLYPYLRKLVPKSRLNNKYTRWKNNCPNSSGHNFDGRYAAINWEAIRKYGTFEFRCQGGSTNPVKIETWALLCQFLVNYCAQPTNNVPEKWSEFLKILPEPFRSWCILRKEKLYGRAPLINARALSGMDLTENFAVVN